MTTADIGEALQLSLAAGWNQTEADWRRLLELDPDGCFSLRCDGRLVATTTLVCYGTRLAWIGMVLTQANYQRRGFARQLIAAALHLADERGIQTVKLDATEQGAPLYESAGFRAEQIVERWSCNGDPAASGTAPKFALDYELDEQAFGADRSALLRSLSELPYRAGYRASYLGPCIAREKSIAREVIAPCLQNISAAKWFWDLLPENRAAVQLAMEFGFAPQRRLIRMVRGAPLNSRTDWTYAIAGFELG